MTDSGKFADGRGEAPWRSPLASLLVCDLTANSRPVVSKVPRSPGRGYRFSYRVYDRRSETWVVLIGEEEP